MKVALLENNRLAVGQAINEALKKAETFDAAVAFVKRSGLGVAEGLRDFARSRRLRLIAGTDFSITEIEALDDLSRSGADSRIFVEGFARSSPPASARTFHPKVYLATGPGKAVVIVGSANLTRGGLSVNHEACIRVEGDPDEPGIRESVQYFESLWNNPYAIPVDDGFRLEYQRLQAARRRAETIYQDHDVARGTAGLLRAHLASLVTGRTARIVGRPEPRWWILVTSLANFEVCKDLQLWGDIDADRITSLGEGEAVVFYIKGVKRLGGLALVRGRPFPLATNPWPEGTYKWGVKVDFLLAPEVTIDFVSLVPLLSFVENKAAWGTHLQGFMRSVSYSDFEVMRSSLATTTISAMLPKVADADGPAELH